MGETMSYYKKSEHFDLALNLLIECKRYIERSYSGTMGRTELLEKIKMFEDILTADFGAV